jgi:hypothetical protein
MVDVITLFVAGMFGVVTVLFVMFFILLRQQNGKHRFETQDYYESSKRDGHVSTGNPFKRSPPGQVRTEQPSSGIVIIALIIIGIAVSIFFDVLLGFLIIFSMPMIVRFIRMRSEASGNKNKGRNGDRPSY